MRVHKGGQTGTGAQTGQMMCHRETVPTYVLICIDCDLRVGWRGIVHRGGAVKVGRETVFLAIELRKEAPSSSGVWQELSLLKKNFLFFSLGFAPVWLESQPWSRHLELRKPTFLARGSGKGRS